MSASVVSCVDASPVLYAGEHVFDLVVLPVEDGIVLVLDAVLCMGRDEGGDAPADERLAEGGGTVGPVCQQMAGWRQVVEHGGSSSVIVGLAFAQMQQQRPSLVVTDHLQPAARWMACTSRLIVRARYFSLSSIG